MYTKKHKRSEMLGDISFLGGSLPPGILSALYPSGFQKTSILTLFESHRTMPITVRMEAEKVQLPSASSLNFTKSTASLYLF